MKSVKAIDANKSYKHVKHIMKALNNNNIGAAADSNNNSFSESKNRTTIAEFEDSFHDDLKSKQNIILQSLKEYKTKNSNNNNDNNNNNYNVVVHLLRNKHEHNELITYFFIKI